MAMKCMTSRHYAGLERKKGLNIEACSHSDGHDLRHSAHGKWSYRGRGALLTSDVGQCAARRDGRAHEDNTELFR